MSSHKERKHQIKNNASKKLLVNLRILAVVYVILFIVMLYSAINSHAVLWQILLGLAIGVIAGVISSRMYKITWDENEAEVIGKIDIYGAVILILFILFEVNRNSIAMLFASGESFGSVGLTLITGALFGRIFGTSRKILSIVRTQ